MLLAFEDQFPVFHNLLLNILCQLLGEPLHLNELIDFVLYARPPRVALQRIVPIPPIEVHLLGLLVPQWVDIVALRWGVQAKRLVRMDGHDLMLWLGYLYLCAIRCFFCWNILHVVSDVVQARRVSGSYLRRVHRFVGLALVLLPLLFLFNVSDLEADRHSRVKHRRLFVVTGLVATIVAFARGLRLLARESKSEETGVVRFTPAGVRIALVFS